MEFEPLEVYKRLKGKGLNFLFHANTTRTSKTFLSNGALLSRAYVENNDLDQTPQKSDCKDKRHNIWDYIFLDAIHISNYFGNYNFYGPILFIFNIDVLLQDEIIAVKISQRNPINWRDDDNDEDKYYQTIDDWNAKFFTGNKYRDGGNHIILVTNDGKLDIGNCLYGIHIDNPNLFVRDGIDGKRKMIANAIFEYYKPDLDRLGLLDREFKIINNTYKQLCYSSMYAFQKDKFKRLFYKS